MIREYDVLASEAEAAGAGGGCISGAGPTVLAMAGGEAALATQTAWQEVMKETGLGGEVGLEDAPSLSVATR